MTQDKYLKLTNNSLIINSLKEDDKGKYICTVETPFESLEYSVELFVHGEPPKILSNFKKLTLYEGEDLGMISHKKSKITIFGHKHKIKISSKKI